MTITSIRPLGGELPPGTVDGYCTNCAGDTIVSAPDYACPACQIPVHPDSLPRDARLAMMRGQAGQPEPDLTAVPVETVRPIAARSGAPAAPAAVKTRVLPPTKAARKWHAATDELVAEAEADEAAAKLKYEGAKSEYEAAAQAAHYARQLRQAARVGGAAETPAAKPATTPKPVAADKPIRTHHVGRHAASGICRGCPPAQEAQTHE